MDSRYRKFLALADEGSFSAAARRLHVTQPAVSLAVSSLELALGAKLYVRRKTPLQLTPEGEVVAKAARTMANEFDRMRAELRQTGASRQRVGIIDSIAHLLYASDARSHLAGMEVIVENSRQILRDLRAGKIDAGIITGQPAPMPDVTVRKLRDEEFVFVAAPQHRPVQPGRIDDWLATEQESTTYQHFQAAFKRMHLQVQPVFHSASMELLRDMAMRGEGTALLPRHIVQDALAAGRLVLADARPLQRPIWAVQLRKNHAAGMPAVEARLNALLARTGGA